MKLYHGTDKENLESILENGLEPYFSEKVSNDERLNQSAVYGFSNIEDAIDFMIYDNNQSEYAIFEIQSEDVVLDPEYEDNNAFAIITNNNINCKLVCQS